MSTRGYKTLVAVVTLLTSLTTQAQFRHFNKMYNHKGWWDNAVGVVDLGNHYLVAGTTADLLSTDSNYYNSLWLYYLDSAGNKGIERVIHFGQYAVHMSNASVLHRTPDGNFLVFGGLTDTLLFKRRTMLMKIDSMLQIKWFSEVDTGLGISEPSYILQMPDSGFMVCGQTSYEKTSLKQGFISRFSKEGQRVWTNYFGVEKCSLNQLVIVNDTTVLVVGVTNTNQRFVTGINISGTYLFQKTVNFGGYGGFRMKKSNSILGGFLVYGALALTPSIGGDIYGLLSRLDSNFEPEWIDTIRLARFSHFIDVFELPGGNIIAVGETDNVNAFNGTTIAWSVKVSSNGQYLREKLYLYEDGRPSHMWGASSTSDGGIICVGTAQNDYEPSPYGQDAWVMKIDTNLCDTPGCGGIIIGTTADEEFKTNDVKVYPNPFNNDLEVAYHTGNLQGVTELRIYNLQGLLVKEVALGNVPEGNIRINMATCSPGLYLVQLVNNGSILKTQKLLKQR
jgi:hypothetical protein